MTVKEGEVFPKQNQHLKRASRFWYISFMSLHDYDVQCPVFTFFMAQTQRFFFPNKQRFLKEFNFRRIHPRFIFLTLFDSNYCNGVRGNAREILNDNFAAVAVLYLDTSTQKRLKLLGEKEIQRF